MSVFKQYRVQILAGLAVVTAVVYYLVGSADFGTTVGSIANVVSNLG